MLGRRSLHLSVALRVTDLTEERRDSAVRLELRHDATQESFEGAEVDVQVEVRRAGGLIWTELSITRESSHLFLIADARASRHVLQCLLTADDREHEQVGAPFGSRFLIVLQGKSKFSSHDSKN